jgi:hypothetical protein
MNPQNTNNNNIQDRFLASVLCCYYYRPVKLYYNWHHVINLICLLLLRFARRVCERDTHAPPFFTYYSFPSTGTKELAAVELTDGSKKLSDGGWGCAALSMLAMETVIV